MLSVSKIVSVWLVEEEDEEAEREEEMEAAVAEELEPKVRLTSKEGADSSEMVWPWSTSTTLADSSLSVCIEAR